ncbi:MAG TPA: potassium transporter Kef [Polyangiaceae bacterium]|nr:potassium transporter Kef [Polyangiaceae bacterium]
MNGIAFLLGLLVLAYVGSILVGGRAIRGFGLASGAEYLVLGFVLGPQVLSVVNHSLIETFQPVVLVGVSWLGLVLGVSYLRVGVRRVPTKHVLLGVALSAIVSAGVSAAVLFAADHFTKLPRSEQIAFAAVAGLICSETTRHSVRWVAERHGAKGPLADLAADTARASALFACVALSVVSAWLPGAALPAFSVLGRVGVTLGLGVVLGFTATLLLGREFRRDESWGILLGTSLLGIGAAARLNLSPITATFAMGLTLAIVSPHRLDIKAMVTPTEKPVLLPVILLAGAYVNVKLPATLWFLVAGALGVKVLARLLCGAAISIAPAARGVGLEFGVGMLSAGALGLAIALAFAVRHPGAVSDALLLLAALGVLIGEWLGPAALRRALTLVGEIKPEEPSPPPARPEAPRLTGQT